MIGYFESHFFSSAYAIVLCTPLSLGYYLNNQLWLITTLPLSVYKMGGFVCRLNPLRELGTFLSGCSIPSTNSKFGHSGRYSFWQLFCVCVLYCMVIILHYCNTNTPTYLYFWKASLLVWCLIFCIYGNVFINNK